MHDAVIRGGTIVDGTGQPAFTGDIAIRDGTIVEVGGHLGAARRTVDAAGLLVTPGWIDIHTHYDGQATWDAELAPSSWHGATSLLLGNCGVGFAPVRRADRDRLIELMEGVEDIPGITLAEGLAWDWETFPEYLDALDRLPRTLNVAAQVPHHALRVFVMGERGLHREQARGDDIREMHRLTAEALAAGAFGFTTSRTDQHKTTAGEFVSGRHAHVDELLGIGAALADCKSGVFGINNDFEDETAEFDWMERLARQTQRPVWFTLSDRPADPARWRRLVSQLRRVRASGAPLMGQVVGRPVGVLLGFQTSLNPFSVRDGYEALEGLAPAQRLDRLRDPAVREQILGSKPSARKVQTLSPSHQAIQAAWDRMFLLSDPPDYEPTPDSTVAAVAARVGLKPDEVAYDHMLGND
ncbi:MAG: N-acyl-D-amino-acid deacylase family protein, partial [Burkholderiaceae bacterium]